MRYRFPEIAPILKKLRQTPCGDLGCSYGREHHDPEMNLKRFFGFSGFKEKPSTPGGESLQRAIVLDGMRDCSLLAILPTGGGKSVCYHLPALVRHRCRGMLTVVVSPLLALMKDPVDSLIRVTGTPLAAAVSGLQTPPERGEALERIRLGDVAILYVAPEQLRSRSVRSVLSQREIGCWVFDEAHCLSKWGHDFRPDYLYAARFIREFAADFNQPVPPVCCFTATAKSDVIQDITSHFRQELGQELELFLGGVQRENLLFEVQPVGVAEKFEQTFQLLSESFKEDDSGSAIVYAETRSRTEEIRDFLRNQGMKAEAFHGRLDAKEKRDIIDDAPADRTLHADGIAEGLFHSREVLKQAEAAWKLTPAQIVIHALHDMAEARLIDCTACVKFPPSSADYATTRMKIARLRNYWRWLPTCALKAKAASGGDCWRPLFKRWSMRPPMPGYRSVGLSILCTVILPSSGAKDSWEADFFSAPFIPPRAWSSPMWSSSATTGGCRAIPAAERRSAARCMSE